MTSLNEVLQKIGNDNRPVEVVLSPAHLFILVSQLQLALRHPENVGASAQITLDMIHQMIALICVFHPEAHDFFIQGFNPSYDLTREEFEVFFPMFRSDDESN